MTSGRYAGHQRSLDPRPHRQGISCRLLTPHGMYRLVPHGVSRILERSLNSLASEPWMRLENLLDGLTV